MILPFDIGARYGDVVHVRADSAYGRLIRRALPGAWGNHDGILVEIDGEPCVCESLLRGGFVATPWSVYADRIDPKEHTSVVFFRAPEWSAEAALSLEREARNWLRRAPKYDWRAILAITARLALRRNLTRGARWSWYCTEIVAEIYRSVLDDDIWGTDLPTPYTTERRWEQGMLEHVGEIIAYDHPAFYERED